MLSPQRLAANRRNAQLSTGPRTAQGKSASSINGLKSGIHSDRLLLPSEDASELAAIVRAWKARYPDPTHDEERLIHAQIHSWWLLHRLAGIESLLKAQESASVLRSAVETLRSLKVGHSRRSSELRAAATRNDWFIQLDRRRRALTLDFHNAKNELTKLRAARGSQAALQGFPTNFELGSFVQNEISPSEMKP